MEKVVCTYCGEEGKPNAKYCFNCGYELPTITFENTAHPIQTTQQKRKTDRKKMLGAIAGIIAFGIAYFVAQQIFLPTLVDRVLMKTAEEINASCPFMVDAGTRLDNTVTLPEKKFQYNYTLINMVKEDMDVASLEENLRTQILNTIRTSPDLQYFREKGVTMIYNYKDKDNVHLFQLIFTPDEYKSK